LRLLIQGRITKEEIMGLRINTNVSALNAQRNLLTNQRGLSKTLERLSSGLRINRAADDAAGLAISEKLRTNIRGLSQAIANSQDSINLVATAEAGIDTTSQILQRVRELAIQSANDTLTNNDREKIQVEIDQLREELTRVADTTNFNTRKLLDGSIAGTALAQNATMEIEQNLRVGDTAATVPVLADFIDSTASVVSGTTATLDVAFSVKFISFQSSGTAPVSVAMEVRSSAEGVLFTQEVGAGAAVAVTQITLSFGQTTGGGIATLATLSVDGSSVSLGDIGKSALIQVTARRDAVTTDSALTFHVGANEGQIVRIGVSNLSASALRLEAVNVVGSNDEDSRIKAQNAIGVIDQALEFVNTARARLGAFQNRVENTISNLSIARENLSASESRIRDADFASETAALTRSQILVQAGTAVLSQANVSTQGALNLL
jgi:flagellin